MLVAVVPAHDEERTLPESLTSLRVQCPAADRVVVVADNCTDGTAAVAARLGAEVVETSANTARKAGALNQALDALLPGLADDDQVLVMDADSAIGPGFLAAATAWLRENPGTGAVGGVFTGRPGGGLVGALQRNEYARYGREMARRHGRAMVLTGTATLFRVGVLRRAMVLTGTATLFRVGVLRRAMVLTGTATLFRVGVLREIADARGDTLPGRHGSVYDTLALTEDNEITLALKTLGHAAASPRECGVLTEIMPTWRDLWHQRLRWQRGALENLRAYGLTRVTLPYAAKQVAMYLGIVAIALFLLATALFAAHGELAPPQGLWLAVMSLFVIERIWTVRARGRRAMLLAAPVVVEFGYDLFQQAVFLRAAADALARRAEHWHHAAPLRVREV